MNENNVSFPEHLQPIQLKNFYKYKNISTEKSLKYLLDSLENKYFYFSHPNQLNDPFDANVPNSYEASDKDIENWISKHDRIKRLTVYDVRKKINDGSFIKILDDAAEKDRNNFCILSLCKSDLNEILWGTYADSYSGVCIGYRGIQFDNEEMNNEKIYYIESLNTNKDEFIPSFRKINEKNYFFIRPILYDNDGKHTYNNFKQEETIKNIEYNIYHKKTIWNPENEFRAILINNPLKPNAFNQKIYYGENTLCEILFGYNISADKKKQIIEIVSKSYSKSSVEFFDVKPDLNTFSLKKIKINI